MAAANDLRKGMAIKYNGNTAIVLEVHHRTPGNLRAFVQAIIRYISSGKSADVRFGSTDKVELIDIDRKQLDFSYKDHNGYHFMDPETYETVTLHDNLLGAAKDYLVENLSVLVLYAEGKPVEVELPASVSLKVVESAEGLRGDTASNVTKPAKLETGKTINVPLFIKEGESIKSCNRSNRQRALSRPASCAPKRSGGGAKTTATEFVFPKSAPIGVICGKTFGFPASKIDKESRTKIARPRQDRSPCRADDANATHPRFSYDPNALGQNCLCGFSPAILRGSHANVFHRFCTRNSDGATLGSRRILVLLTRRSPLVDRVLLWSVAADCCLRFRTRTHACHLGPAHGRTHQPVSCRSRRRSRRHRPLLTFSRSTASSPSACTACSAYFTTCSRTAVFSMLSSAQPGRFISHSPAG